MELHRKSCNNFLDSPMAGVMPEIATINRQAARAGSPRRSHQVAAAQGVARRRRRNRSKTAGPVSQVFIHWCQNEPSGYLSPSHTANFPQPHRPPGQ